MEKKSILTPKQRREYADALRDGVPPEVIREFCDALDQAEARWKRELRAAVRAGRPAILRDDDA